MAVTPHIESDSFLADIKVVTSRPHNLKRRLGGLKALELKFVDPNQSLDHEAANNSVILYDTQDDITNLAHFCQIHAPLPVIALISKTVKDKNLLFQTGIVDYIEEDALDHNVLYSSVHKAIARRIASKKERTPSSTPHSVQVLEEYDFVLDSIDLGVIFLDPELRIRAANEVAKEIWNLTEDLILSKTHVKDLIEHNRHSGTYTIHQDNWDDYITTRIKQIQEAKLPPSSIKHQNGRVFNFDIKALPDGGRLLTYFETTELSKAEAALDQERTLLRNIIDATPDWIYVKNADHKFQLVNKAFANVRGLDPEDFIGKNELEMDLGLPKELVLGNPEKGIRGFWNDDDDVIRTGEPKIDEGESDVIDGQEYFLHTVKVPLSNENETPWGVLGFSHDITKLKQAETALVAKNAYLATLHETSLGLMNRLELSELLDTIVKRATKLLNVPHGFIYLSNEEKTLLELAGGVGLFEEQYDINVALGEGVSGLVWQTGEALIVKDYQAWEHQLSDKRFKAIKSVVSVPLKAGNTIIGVLGCASDGKVKPITQADLELLTDFAQLASIALDNARLYNETQKEIKERKQQEDLLRESEYRYRELFLEANRKTKELELLDKLQAAIANKLELEELFYALVNTITEIFGYSMVSIGYLQGQDLIYGPSKGYSKEIPTVGINETIARRVINRQKAELIDNVSIDPDLGLDYPEHEGSLLALPFYDQRAILGVLFIENRKSLLEQSDLSLMTKVTDHINIAIENARLHERTKEDLRRTEVLYQISQVVNNASSLDKLLERVNFNIRNAFSARWSTIIRIESDTGIIPLRSINQTAQAGLDILQHWVRHDQKAILLNKDDVLSYMQKDTWQSEEIGSVLIAPLFYQGKTLGAICCVNHLNDPSFKNNDLVLMKSFANQIAVALNQRELMDTIEHQAYHDGLTNLPNRSLFEDRLEQALLRAQRMDHKVGIVFIDLDRFKHINDTLGHHVGDQLIIQVAERLKSNTRESDTLARMGGDEFALILHNIKSNNKVVNLGHKYLSLFSKPFTIGKHELYVTASIGVSIYPEDGKKSTSLLQHADTAMYRAKSDGKNNVRSFTIELAQQAKERLSLELDLRRALENNELLLHYQPQIDLQTDERVGVEALIRWQHPTKGLIPPLKFIPIAEESGLIMQIGEWVLHEACRQAKAWQTEGRKPLRVAVNISARQFARSNFLRIVKTALIKSGLEAKWLELEVTESVVMNDVEQVAERLQALRDLGVRIALDDFGTGYSSLQYLQKLPFDNLKIDRSFVSNIDNPQDNALLRTIVLLANNFGLNVVAEGLETIEQRDFLKGIGCEEAQGYFYSKPLPANQLFTN